MSDYLVSEFSGGEWLSPVGHPPSRKRIVESVEGYGEKLGRIGDFGCGTGALTQEIAAVYDDTQVIGIDISPESSLEAEENTSDYDNVDIVCGDVNAVLDHRPIFDAIFAANYVQDTEDPVETLRNIYTLMEEGGDAVVTVPGEEGRDKLPQEWFYERKVEIQGEEVWLHYMEPEMPVEDLSGWGQYLFPQEETSEILQKLGFEIMEADKLTAKAEGISTIGRFIGDRRMRMAGWAAGKLQTLIPEAGPKVDMYRVRK